MVETFQILIIVGIAVFGVIAVPPLLHDQDTGASILDQLFDVNATVPFDNWIIVFENSTQMWNVINGTQFVLDLFNNFTQVNNTHVNIGTGAKIIKFENSTQIQVRTIKGGGGVTVTELANEIEIKTGGGPNGTAKGIAKIQTPNGLFEASSIEDTVNFFGEGIAISNSSSIFFKLNATLDDLNDVNITDISDGDVIRFNQTSNIWENHLLNALRSLVDIHFAAEVATVDDQGSGVGSTTGSVCTNDVTISFFDNTHPNQYRRQAIEFCPNADTDDNITWLWSVPKDYVTKTDFEFRLFWTDTDSGSSSFTKRVIASLDDAESRSSSPFDMDLTSTDLELHNGGGQGEGQIGMRWTGVTIPNGATILSAKIQFHVDEVNPNQPLTVRFRGHAHDNSPQFTSANGDLNSRTGTTAFVDWAVPHWVNVHDEGAAQLSADIKTIVQEIVNRAGWSSGNAMTIMIREWPINTGERHAESFDGESGSSPQLQISYSVGGGFSPVCFEYSMMNIKDSQILDGVFKGRQTVCKDKSGTDKLTITKFVVPETTHTFENGDLVFFRIHRPNDFVPNDFEGNVYVLGSDLRWLD